MEFTPAFYCHHAGGYNILILKGSFVCRVAASSNKANQLGCKFRCAPFAPVICSVGMQE
jgi:hypothetical protein